MSLVRLQRGKQSEDPGPTPHRAGHRDRSLGRRLARGLPGLLLVGLVVWSEVWLVERAGGWVWTAIGVIAVAGGLLAVRANRRRYRGAAIYPAGIVHGEGHRGGGGWYGSVGVEVGDGRVVNLPLSVWAFRPRRELRVALVRGDEVLKPGDPPAIASRAVSMWPWERYAIAGMTLVIGALVIVVGIGMSLEGSTADGTKIDATDLGMSEGDCLVGDLEVIDISEADVVRCSQPHDAEVFRTLTIPDGVGGAEVRGQPYPGDDALINRVEEDCLERFERFVGVSYELSSLEFWIIYPSEDAWDEGDRQALCALTTTNGAKLHSSAEGTRR